MLPLYSETEDILMLLPEDTQEKLLMDLSHLILLVTLHHSLGVINFFMILNIIQFWFLIILRSFFGLFSVLQAWLKHLYQFPRLPPMCYFYSGE